MPVNDGDIVRAVVTMSWSDDDIQNVYHMEVSAAAPQDEADVMTDLGSFFDDLYGNWDNLMPSEISFDTIEAWNVTQNAYIGVTAFPTLTTGLATTDPLPPQIAGLALFETDVSRSQGRKFLPTAVVGAMDTDGTLSTTALTQVGAYLVDALVGVTGTYIDAKLGNWNPTLARFAEWVSGTARDIWATQRRRYFGRGS